MFKAFPRRFLLLALLLALPLGFDWVVRAAIQPPGKSDTASTATPPAGATATSNSGTASADVSTSQNLMPVYGYSLQVPVTGPTTQFHNSVAARYNYAFGKDRPFLPSNATSYNGQFMSPKDFPTAKYCGHCHQEAYHQWRESAHGNSFRTPWYVKNVNMLIDTKGVQYSRHCEGCHNPVALLSGDLSQGMPVKRPFEDEGVTCSTCHSIVKTTTIGTGSWVMGYPAVLVDENGDPVKRPVSDAEILAHLDRHKAAVMRPLYKTAEFCAACHKAALPRELNNYKWLRAIPLYDEWQGTSFVKQSPLPFYRKPEALTCQSCHMKAEPLPDGARDSGAKDGKLISHRWAAGNSLIPAYYHYPDQMAKLKDFFKNGPDGKGVLNVDIFALERDDSTPATETSKRSPSAKDPSAKDTISALGNEPFSLTAGETLIADVVIQNKGVGHSLIPEQRDFYQAWVDFQLKDAATGKILEESGFIKPDGHLDPSAHSFTNRLINDKGTLNGLHQVWDTHVLAYNNALQSGRSQLVRYRFRLPRTISAKGVTISATVKYRRFNQRFIDFIMDKKHYPQPVLEFASQTRTLYAGINKPTTPGPQDNPTWMRWVNYGIGLLDAQQYKASVAAFQHVADLRPYYADAYTDMAVVEIVWERYDDAKAHLAKALELLPNDARALYYRALVERNADQVDAAIVDLKSCVEQFPRFKGGWRELGFAYYQKHEYAAARDAYLKIQEVDPDDLGAHYQLAIIYRRLGDKEQSRIESEKFADQKNDPTASVYALEFLSRHPEVAAESVVWHTHDITGDPIKRPAKIEYHYIPGAG
ncbi:MAG TPA: multiheme c-type cytochrome [Terracidiphilus sp.]|nr:multiheme c-type cytochrome [Terracidiphilus sp.]